MKNVLPILLCYVLMTSQVYAISGGPNFGGSGLNPFGTYSGVIEVNDEKNFGNGTTDPETTVPDSVDTNPNAIGLFTLGVPNAGVATGSFLMFVEGVVFTGTITASVNPDSDSLAGIVNGSYQYTLAVEVTDPTTGDVTLSDESLTASANGKINAKIGSTRGTSIASATLNGTSTIAVNDGSVTNGLQFKVNRQLDCTVVGFRQSTTSSAATSVTSVATGG